MLSDTEPTCDARRDSGGDAGVPDPAAKGSDASEAPAPDGRRTDDPWERALAGPPINPNSGLIYPDSVSRRGRRRKPS